MYTWICLWWLWTCHLLRRRQQLHPLRRFTRCSRRIRCLQREKEHISREVYDAYKAIELAESVTIDPHKMGYIPYSGWYRYPRYPYARRYFLLRNLRI